MKKPALLLMCLAFILTKKGAAQNPIVQTIYIADPAPMVYKDTVFLYTGHDEDRSNGS